MCSNHHRKGDTMKTDQYQVGDYIEVPDIDLGGIVIGYDGALVLFLPVDGKRHGVHQQWTRPVDVPEDPDAADAVMRLVGMTHAAHVAALADAARHADEGKQNAATICAGRAIGAEFALARIGVAFPDVAELCSGLVGVAITGAS